MILKNEFSLYLIFSLLIAIFWSIGIFSTWSTDYSVYYGASMFISDDYKLYENHFAHKGPAYYFFTNIIGKIFGWGGKKIALPILVTVFLYLISGYLLFKSFVPNKKFIFILFISLVSTLSYQNFNATISYFQFSNLFFSLTFLILSFKRKSIFYLFLAIIFFNLAYLTRLDAVVFAPLFIISIYYFNKNSYKVLNFIAFILISYLINIFFSDYYDYSFSLFFEHNYLFNKWFRDHHFALNPLTFLHRVNNLKIFLASGLGVLFFILVSNIKNYKLFKINIKDILKFKKNKYLIKSKNKPEIIFLFMASVIFLFIWLYSASDKTYHGLPLQSGILLLITSLFINKKIKFSNFYVTPLALLIIYSLFATSLKPALHFLSDVNCIEKLSCKGLNNRISNSTMSDLLKVEKAAIIDGDGWAFILSGTPPMLSINNWIPYETVYYETVAWRKYDKANLSKKKLTIWVSKRILDRDYEHIYGHPLDNKNLKKILEKSKIIEDQGRYIKILINNY